MKFIAMSVAAGCLLTAGLAGCGDESPGPDAGEQAAAGSYDGPLYVASADYERGDPHRDMGAAVDVVQCSTPMQGGFSDSAEGPYDDGSTADSPLAALDDSYQYVYAGPLDVLEEAGRTDDRVLYTYSVDGVAKLAMIVHNGPTISEEGWYLESWASCNAAEFPDAIAEAMGSQVWTDADGNRVSTTEVASFPGPSHCDWQDMTFLSMGNDRLYIGNLDPEYVDHVSQAPEEDIALPNNAVDTGFERAGMHLWLSPNEAVAYVGDEQSVDLWPMADKDFACA